MSTKQIITIIIIALSLTVAGVAFSAEPQVTIEPKWTELKSATRGCDGFPEDNLILKIRINKKEITDEFCSSYGKADAKIIKDAQRVNFLMLKTAQGRGTHVTAEYLTVYRIEDSLEELARFPAFEPVGRLSGIYYNYEVKKPKNGGLLFLVAIRIVTGPEDSEWAYLIPKEKKRTILIK